FTRCTVRCMDKGLARLDLTSLLPRPGGETTVLTKRGPVRSGCYSPFRKRILAGPPEMSMRNQHDHLEVRSDVELDSILVYGRPMGKKREPRRFTSAIF